MPTVREQLLDGAVMDAVRQLMTDPAVILEPLRQLDQRDARQADQLVETAQEVEREAKRMAAEEQRILDAYRTGVITPSQLGQQLEKLKAQKATLNLQKQEIEQANTIPPKQAAEAVSDYCAEAASNLSKLPFEQWRELLRTVIVSITFHGDRLSIQGRIPIKALGSAGAFRLSARIHPGNLVAR